MSTSRDHNGFVSREATSQIGARTKRSSQYALGLMASVAIMLLNKDNLVAMFSTSALLTFLVGANLLFVLIWAWKWFLFVENEIDLMSSYLKSWPKTFSVSWVFSYPVIIGFVYAFYIASVTNIVLFISFAIVTQLISFIGDCMTMNVLVHESNSCECKPTPNCQVDYGSTDKMNALIRNEILKYYLDGRYVVRIPFYFLVQLFSLLFVIAYNNSFNQKVLVAYGLTLFISILNETYLALLRYGRNNKILEIRNKFAEKNYRINVGKYNKQKLQSVEKE